MNNELYHHGIKGQKWGIKRYQDSDLDWTKIGLKRRAEREGWGYKSGNSNKKSNQNRIIKNERKSGISDITRTQNMKNNNSKSIKEIAKIISEKDKENEAAHKHHNHILKEVKRTGKSAAQIEHEERLKKPFHLTSNQKKAIAIGAAVAVTALAIYGVYKYNSINNSKFNEELVNKLLNNKNTDPSNSAKTDFLKKAFGDRGDFHAFDNTSENKQIIDNMLTKSSSEWWLGLSESQKQAIVDYTGNDYIPMNSQLWSIKNNNIHDYPSTDTIKKIIDCNSALKKASFPTDMVCTQGLTTHKAATFLNCSINDLYKAAHNPESDTARKLIGAVNTNHGFVSTTTCANGGFSGGVKYKILLPKGSHAAYVEHISKLGDLPFKNGMWDGKSTGGFYKSYEFETLIAAGSKFKTRGIQYNNTDNVIEVALEYMLDS